MSQYGQLLAAAAEVAIEQQSEAELEAIQNAVVYRVRSMELAQELERAHKTVEEQEDEIVMLRSRVEELAAVADAAQDDAALAHEENAHLRTMIKKLISKLNRYASFQSSLASIFDPSPMASLPAAPSSSYLSSTSSPYASSPLRASYASSPLSSSTLRTPTHRMQSRYTSGATMTPNRTDRARSLVNDFVMSPIPDATAARYL